MAFDGPGTLVVEQRFAMVPEWVLDADVSDGAVRLYAVLLRYGESSGSRMPGRATLARRLHRRCTDTVDRALRELVALGAVVVEHRFDGGQRLTNRYHVRTSPPETAQRGAAKPARGGRSAAATQAPAATGTPAAGGGRGPAATVAAGLRPDPEQFTETPPPPAPTARPANAAAGAGGAAGWEPHARLLAACGIADLDGLDGLAEACRRLRPAGDTGLARWSAQGLLAAIGLAVRGRGRPAGRVPAALLAVAGDPLTRSPMRLAEAGPWWQQPDTDSPVDPTLTAKVAAMEEALADADGWRVVLQRQAREQLAAEGALMTRATVTARAYDLLQQRGAP